MSSYYCSSEGSGFIHITGDPSGRLRQCHRESGRSESLPTEIFRFNLSVYRPILPLSRTSTEPLRLFEIIQKHSFSPVKKEVRGLRVTNEDRMDNTAVTRTPHCQRSAIPWYIFPDSPTSDFYRPLSNRRTGELLHSGYRDTSSHGSLREHFQRQSRHNSDRRV